MDVVCDVVQQSLLVLWEDVVDHPLDLVLTHALQHLEEVPLLVVHHLRLQEPVVDVSERLLDNILVLERPS